MKLNAASELEPISWEGFANIHPYAPKNQCLGYEKIITDISEYLCEITGLDSISLQPNSGAQGEYTGLIVIRKYLDNNNGKERNICLIPSSAHGTNPASAVMAGFEVKIVKCNEYGDIDYNDIEEKVKKYKNNFLKSEYALRLPDFHYRNQTWVGDKSTMLCVGIYGQAILVDQKNKIEVN